METSNLFTATFENSANMQIRDTSKLSWSNENRFNLKEREKVRERERERKEREKSTKLKINLDFHP